MTAAALLTGLAYGLLWLFAGLIVALILGACTPHTDRNRDSEESEAQPIGETGRISFFHVVGDTDV
jgi:hypothetical protein